MLLVLTTVIEVLAVLAVLFVAGALATRDTELLAEAPPDDPDLDLPVGPLQPEDIGALRFGMVLRGYRMREVDETLRRVTEELAARDERIAALEQALVDVVEPQLAEVEQQLASPGVVLDAAVAAAVAAPVQELPDAAAPEPGVHDLATLPSEGAGTTAEPDPVGIRTAPEEPAPAPVPVPTSPPSQEPEPVPAASLDAAPLTEPEPAVTEPEPVVTEPAPLGEPEPPFAEPVPLVEPTPLAEPEPLLQVRSPETRVSPTGISLPSLPSDDTPEPEPPVAEAPHWPQPAAEPEPEKLADDSLVPADDEAFPEIPTGDDRA